MRELSERKNALLALLLLVPAPSIGVLAALYIPGLAGTATGQAIWITSKGWLVLFPIVWRVCMDKEKLSWSPLKQGGLWQGFGLGMAMAAAIGAVYLLPDPPLVDAAMIREQAAINQLDRLPVYLTVALSLSFVNALIEEVVWRWFVFAKIMPLTGHRDKVAIPLAALCFTAHHILVLAVQMPLTATVLASLGVFVAGCIWSWCYARYRSIWPCYVCHILADLAIFAAGWDMIFNA